MMVTKFLLYYIYYYQLSTVSYSYSYGAVQQYGTGSETVPVPLLYPNPTCRL
jgi:hypothetical protein